MEYVMIRVYYHLRLVVASIMTISYLEYLFLEDHIAVYKAGIEVTMILSLV